MKNLQLSVGEQSIIAELQRIYEITEIEAIEHVVAQKRELAFIHNQKGNIELARQLLKELNEWTPEAEKDFQQLQQAKTKKIILL